MSKSALLKAAVFFAERSGKRIGKKFREVSIILQDDDLSDEVHQGIMGVAGATDVITQAYESIPPEPEGIYGELYVNTQQAMRYSQNKKNWPASKELLLYVAHGMDHLSGADDLEDKERLRMRRRELKWLADFTRTAKVLLLAFIAFLGVDLYADTLWSNIEYDYERFYSSAQALQVIPTSSGSMSSSIGAIVRLGYYVDDFLTIEGAFAQTDDASGLALRSLWHWWGYEKLDPFFTFGASGWFDGDVGPSLGWGSFWHFNDNWSMRVDTDMTFGIEQKDECFFSLALGVQYSF